MKKLTLFIGIILISVMSYGQYSNYNPPKHGWVSLELGGSVSVLGGTFVVIDHRINNKIGTEKQTAMIAASGMLISTGLHFGSRYIRENDIKLDLKRFKYDIKNLLTKNRMLCRN